MRKLDKYIIASKCTLVSPLLLNAQIQYTDLDPDSMLITSNSDFSIDLNNDAIDDVVFYHDGSSNSGGIYVKNSLGDKNNQFYPVGGVYYWEAYYFQKYDVIGTSRSVNPYGYGYLLRSSNGSNTSGSFYLNSEGFVGFAFLNGSDSVFGWIRVSTPSFDSLVVKDFAYNTVNQSSIPAGYCGKVKDVTALSIADINNNNDGSDIQVNFAKSVNEKTGVENYWIAIAKDNATDLDTATFNSLPANRKTQISTTGNDITYTFSSNTLDTDGDAISNGNSYKAFVYIEPINDVIYFDASISSASNSLALKADFPVMDGVSDNLENNNINIFTNQNKEILINNDEKETIEFVEIINLNGQIITRKKVNNKLTKIQLNSYKSGVYIVNVALLNGKNYTKKIILK